MTILARIVMAVISFVLAVVVIVDPVLVLPMSIIKLMINIMGLLFATIIIRVVLILMNKTALAGTQDRDLNSRDTQ